MDMGFLIFVLNDFYLIISIMQLQSVLNLHETEAKVAELRNKFRGQTVMLGVDDMDIFKGISLKLLAMEQLLMQHTENTGEVVLVQIANPLRGRGRDVQEIQSETYATVRRINNAFGRPVYDPVVLIDAPLQFYKRIAFYETELLSQYLCTIHNKEYGFGAHDFPISGVFEVEPKSCPGFIYRCSISLGFIHMPFSEFRALIESVASEYHGDTYHLISKNCNHFTEDMVHRLTGKHIPRWVNRLARLGYFCSCLLPESLQVTTVKQLPEYHEIEEETESLSTASPGDSIEMDDTDPEKQLLSPKEGPLDISFIKEAQTYDCRGA
ncbi:uncharacterized protein LOC120198902 [Hibiscus syriacus]|uniref:uncharacterized protein LOC120198902 n=1 Tax=Hibiscus syriacus TaxID=106335 RepID=UPI001922EAB9|nr:uncharacterized protein LOC120198902 [Hibiscus syriacus]